MPVSEIDRLLSNRLGMVQAALRGDQVRIEELDRDLEFAKDSARKNSALYSEIINHLGRQGWTLENQEGGWIVATPPAQAEEIGK
jgi:hypothetical protein